MVELIQSRSIKLKGKLQGQDITIMMDSRATDNFIHVSLLNEFKLLLNESMSYKITMGNRHTIKGCGNRKDVTFVKLLPKISYLYNYEAQSVYLACNG